MNSHKSMWRSRCFQLTRALQDQFHVLRKEGLVATTSYFSCNKKATVSLLTISGRAWTLQRQHLFSKLLSAPTLTEEQRTAHRALPSSPWALAGVQPNTAVHRGSPQGGDAHQVLSLAPVGNAVLLKTNSNVSGEIQLAIIELSRQNDRPIIFQLFSD